MIIQFPGPAVPAPDGGISYRALVDGESVACMFSMEALQDVNPELSNLDSHSQFEASKPYLLQIAERKILSNGVENGVVRIFSADVRS